MLNTANSTQAPSDIVWQTINEELTLIDGWELLSETIDGRHSFLIEYYKRCRRGEFVIGRELMTQLEMLIQEMRNDDYRFILEDAHKRIKFIETKLKHFESPFAGKPFLLTLEQKAIAEAVFGFYVFDEDFHKWLRRFKEVLLVIARKNGKTPYTAALALAEWCCGEMGQKVMCASNDHEQASIIYDCINNMREESRSLEKVTRSNQRGIFWGNYKQRKKTGKFSRQNKGTIKKMSARMRAKEGRNLKIVIVDEVHEMKDRSTVMPLRSSLTTQEEPLYFEITTEGIVRDGYLDERLALARRVLKGELQRNRWLIWLYTQDNEAEIWNDETAWAKSNPMLGIVKKRSELRDLVEEARISGAQRAFTLAKEFNLPQLSATAYLEEKILDNRNTFDLDDFRGAWCIVGVDLSETNDLCAVALILMRHGDPVKYIHTMYFVTEVKAGESNSTDAPTNPEKKNYNEWAADGLCRIVEGNIIDDAIVADYLFELFEKYQIRPLKCGYDVWHAKDFVARMIENFGNDVLVKVPMTFDGLNVPMRNIEEDLRAGVLNYQFNPICRWNFRNTAVRHNSLGWVMPEKIKGYIGNKIDGTVAKAIAYATMRQCKSEFMSLLGG